MICTRGGYGVQRLLDDLDVAAVRADPKLVVGFSDITALQLALWRGARLATVHGPGAAWLDERTGPESAESLRRALEGQVAMDPGNARRFVEQLALVLQASVLLRTRSPVADAFCRSRLHEPHRLAFGTLAAGIDTESILVRAL